MAKISGGYSSIDVCMRLVLRFMQLVVIWFALDTLFGGVHVHTMMYIFGGLPFARYPTLALKGFLVL